MSNLRVRAGALAVGGAWLAFMAGLLLGGEIEGAGSFVFAAVGGAAIVFLGFAAASRCRPLPRRVHMQRTRLTLMSVAAGMLLGVGNLAANWTIAELDPAIRALLIERMATLEPVEALIASPIVEEVAVRLFLMSAIAWVVFRFTRRATLAFAVALVGSALFFAVLHLGRPFPGDPALANYYRTALVVKYTIAGVPLGWIFWRWGLPYAILCHAAGNTTHFALQNRLF